MQSVPQNVNDRFESICERLLMPVHVNCVKPWFVRDFGDFQLGYTTFALFGVVLGGPKGANQRENGLTTLGSHIQAPWLVAKGSCLPHCKGNTCYFGSPIYRLVTYVAKCFFATVVSQTLFIQWWWKLVSDDTILVHCSYGSRTSLFFYTGEFPRPLLNGW